MDGKPLLALALMAIVLSGGCLSEGKVRYFCPDGREVSDNSLCFGSEDSCNSVSNILENDDYCNLKKVDITGKATNLDLKTSKKGSNYTTFNLEDEGKQLKVFAWKHLPINEGEDVRVKGTFHKVKYVGKYSFKNEIEASIVEVK